MSEPNNKCSENNRCHDCKNWLEEKLKECEDWEIKRKESYKKFESRFCPNQISRNDDEMPDLPKYSETGGETWVFCSKCGKSIKKNNYGDIYPHEQNCQGGKENKDNPREREREREQIQQYFKSNNIKSIKLENNQLVIEYNNSQTESKEVNNQELQAIKSYAEKLGKSELSLKDLEQSGNTQTPKSNQVLWWGLGIVGVLVVGVVVWLVVRNNKSK